MEKKFDFAFDRQAENVDNAISLLDFLGYKTEKTEWDFSDLSFGAKRRIRSMHLLSHYQDEKTTLQIFHIETQKVGEESSIKTSQLLPILDTFLRRYSQGKYFFIFSDSQGYFLIFHLRKVEWLRYNLRPRFITYRIDTRNLRKTDWWLLQNLMVSDSKQQSAREVWNKHCAVFDELKRRRNLKRRERIRRPLLGVYFNDIQQYRVPPQEYKDDLLRRLQSGDMSAKNELVQSHLWMVVKEAKKYQNLGLDIMDLIQEGNNGLLKAIDKFDPSLGYQFSTYAMWWVKQKIKRALADTSLFIRIPAHVFDGSFYKIAIAEKKLKYEFYFRPPLIALVLMSDDLTHEERADAWYCWLNNIPFEVEFKKRFIALYKKTKKLLDSAQGVLSLDEKIPRKFSDSLNTISESEDDYRLILEDVICDSQDIKSEAEKSLLFESVQSALKCIPPREKRVIEFRFGINSYEQRTLEEIAQKMSVTRERVRQIENTALDRLRRMAEIKALRESLTSLPQEPRDGFILLGEVVGSSDEDGNLYSMYGANFYALRSEDFVLRDDHKEEIECWQNLSPTSLVAEVCKHPKVADLFDGGTSLFDFIFQYTSPEYNRRTSNFDAFLRKQDQDIGFFENDSEERGEEIQ